MTTAKSILRVLAGEAISPPPIWLMRQAGRYLPEYRALREQAGSFMALCTTPHLAAEVTLQPLRRYAMDAAILFSDILILPWALGQKLSFIEGEGPVLPPIRDAKALSDLDPSRLEKAVEPIMETVQRVRAEVGSSALIGFAGSPFTVACYMVEGHGSKEFGAVRMMAMTQPDLFANLMDLVTDSTIRYLSMQIEAGAEAVMLFDSWAGVLSPRLFREHVTAPTVRIVKSLRGLHPGVRIIGFPRLAGLQVRDYAVTTEVDAVALDTSVDPVEAAAIVPEGIALQGNLDPLALVAGGTMMDEDTDAILTAMRGRGHIFNLGHGIVPQTPPDNVARLVAHVRRA